MNILIGVRHPTAQRWCKGTMPSTVRGYRPVPPCCLTDCDRATTIFSGDRRREPKPDRTGFKPEKKKNKSHVTACQSTARYARRWSTGAQWAFSSTPIISWLSSRDVTPMPKGAEPMWPATNDNAEKVKINFSTF